MNSMSRELIDGGGRERDSVRDFALYVMDKVWTLSLVAGVFIFTDRSKLF